LYVVSTDTSAWLPTFVEFIANNWALFGIVATLGLLISYPWMILRKYVRVSLNLIDDVSPPRASWSNGYKKPQGEQVSFIAFDGHRLSGTVIPGNPDRPKRGLVIFGHEFESDQSSAGRNCHALLEAGYDVLTFDFRGHGLSASENGYKPRQFASDREQSDMLGAIAFAEDYLAQQGRPARVGLFGMSRGACATVLGAKGVPCVKAIACDGLFSCDITMEYCMKKFACVFAKIRVVYENHPPATWQLLRWMLFLRCRRVFNCRFPLVRKTLPRLGRVPMLFIHGSRDTFVPVDQCMKLFRLARGPKHAWVVDGAKHNQAVDVAPAEYGRRLVTFFDKYLSELPPSGLARSSAVFDSFADTSKNQESEVLNGNGRGRSVSTRAKQSLQQG
jgi:pimeloyl-ACP methyl ester carboxylesterase